MATPAQLDEKVRDPAPSAINPRVPPQLPPRSNVVASPPPYSSDDIETQTIIMEAAKKDMARMASKEWRTRDLKSPSTESLYPLQTGPNDRRTLLLVYIHGFMGNESSFQSFPADVHSQLGVALHETHSVHTKIYPRYKSRKDVEFARDEFSKW